MWLIYLLVGALHFGVYAHLDDRAVMFIRDFAAFKRIKILMIFVCSSYENWLVSKRLSEELPIYVTTGDHESPWLGKVGITYNKLGVLVDHDCSFGQQVLNKVSSGVWHPLAVQIFPCKPWLKHLMWIYRGWKLKYSLCPPGGLLCRRFPLSAVMGVLNDSSCWLVWSTGPPHESLEVRADTDLTWATPQPSGAVSLSDVYRLTLETPLNVTPTGQWNKQGLRYLLTSSRYRRRQNFHGLVFQTAVVVTNMPTDNLRKRLTSPYNRHLDTSSKVNYAIHSHLQAMFNYSVQLHPTPSWGYLMDNGSYDGMIGMLQRKVVVMGITSAVIRIGRLSLADFMGHTWTFQSFLIFRHPKVIGIQSSLFTPFSSEVWICSGIVAFLVISALRLVASLENGQFGAETIPSPSTPENSWSAVMLFAVGTISQHGTAYESRLMTWKLVIMVAFVLAIFLNAYYSAAIVTALLVPPPRTIRTVRDLIDSPLEVGMENLSYNHDFFARTTNKLALELYHKKIKPSGKSACNCYSLSEGVVRLRKGMFAFHTEVTNIYPVIEETFTDQAKCEMTLMPLMPQSITSCPTQKGWAFRKMISYGLHTIFEHGLTQREMMYWKPKPPRCTARDEPVSIELRQTLPAFLLLAAGILLAFLILLVERSQKLKFCKR